jgi:hypothetical protein
LQDPIFSARFLPRVILLVKGNFMKIIVVAAVVASCMFTAAAFG